MPQLHQRSQIVFLNYPIAQARAVPWLNITATLRPNILNTCDQHALASSVTRSNAQRSRYYEVGILDNGMALKNPGNVIPLRVTQPKLISLLRVVPR